MSRTPDQAPDDTEIAAEYVLRVLKPEAHRAAAIRAASEPAFAAEVRAWEDRFAPMMDEVDPVDPDPASRTALMTRLFGSTAAPRPVDGATNVWQILTAIGFAAAAALAVIMVAPQTSVPLDDTTRFVAELAAEDGSTRMFAMVEPDSGVVNVSWTARDQPDDRAIELWGIPDGGDPISIGVLPAGTTASLTLPEALAAQTTGLVLAISDEPLGGSPTGAPTGAVLAATPVSEI